MEKARKVSRKQELSELVLNLRKASKLDSWSSFVEELKLPSEIFPAIMTGRPELLRIAQPRAITAEEHAAYLALIAGLIETNAALRAHTEQVAHLVETWMGQFQGSFALAQQINQFAAFQPLVELDA